MENKKSLNKLWRELGKPMSFKDFAQKYNHNQAVVYKSATGVDSTAASSVPAPLVVTPNGNIVILGVILAASALLVYSLSENK